MHSSTRRLLDSECTRKADRLMARKTFLARAARAFYLVRGKRDPWVGIEVTF
jgi:hypothetical protein